jgi:hypothetical protein
MNKMITCRLCGKTIVNSDAWPVCKNGKYIHDCCRDCWDNNNKILFDEFFKYYMANILKAKSKLR